MGRDRRDGRVNVTWTVRPLWLVTPGLRCIKCDEQATHLAKNSLREERLYCIDCTSEVREERAS